MYITNFRGDPSWNAVVPVPEPSTYALFVGLAAIGVISYRRRRKLV
jgi:hypothetical protein